VSKVNGAPVRLGREKRAAEDQRPAKRSRLSAPFSPLAGDAPAAERAAAVAAAAAAAAVVEEVAKHSSEGLPPESRTIVFVDTLSNSYISFFATIFGTIVQIFSTCCRHRPNRNIYNLIIN
jgi:hypothetical protein